LLIVLIDTCSGCCRQRQVGHSTTMATCQCSRTTDWITCFTSLSSTSWRYVWL